MRTNRPLLISLILLMVVATLYRAIPGREFGFAPQIAMALFAGAVIKDKKWAILFPVLSMFLSDMLYHALYKAGLYFMPGFYEGQWQNYLLFAGLVFIGFLMKKINIVNVLAGSIVAPLVFFLASNFIVWAGWQGTRGLGRPKTFDGLMMCYNDALPFLRMHLVSTLIFSTVLFGGYYLMTRKNAQLKTAH